MHYFGWQYSAKLIAEYENCTVTQGYEMSTIECLNILSYLKAKTDFDNEQIKKIRQMFTQVYGLATPTLKKGGGQLFLDLCPIYCYEHK